MTLVGLLTLIRRRWIPVVLCVVAGLAGATIFNSRAKIDYQSSAVLILNIPAARTAEEALSGAQLGSQLIDSYAAVATSRAAATTIQQRLLLPDSPDAIRGELTATPQPNTLLLTIAAKDRSPLRAQLIANTAAQVFIDKVSDLERGEADPIVARLIDNAAVGSAVGPHKKLNLIIGLLVGLVVGTGIARIVESLDRTLKTPVQATELFKAPLLGVVPRAKRDGLLPSTIADDPRSQAGEAYRSLRTAVRFVNPDRPLRTLLVTSPTAKDGKTTTAANLALALAQSGERVVLVDADLRRSRVADLMGVPGDLGVSSIVTRQADFEHCVVGWRDLLAVVAAGPLPPNPSELLGSQAMRDLIGHLGQFADVAVFDAPPILPVTDAVVLATQLDGVLLVARSGKTLRTSAVEAVRRLDAVGANVVGCVLNGVSGFTSGGYYEDYRYLARRPARTRFGRRATDVVSA